MVTFYPPVPWVVPAYIDCIRSFSFLPPLSFLSEMDDCPSLPFRQHFGCIYPPHLYPRFVILHHACSDYREYTLADMMVERIKISRCPTDPDPGLARPDVGGHHFKRMDSVYPQGTTRTSYNNTHHRKSYNWIKLHRGDRVEYNQQERVNRTEQ